MTREPYGLESPTVMCLAYPIILSSRVITHVIRCTRSRVIQLLSLLSGSYPCYPAVILVIQPLSLLSDCYLFYPTFILCYPDVTLWYPDVILKYSAVIWLLSFITQLSCFVSQLLSFFIRLLSLLSGCYPCYNLLSGCNPDVILWYPAVILKFSAVILRYQVVILCYPAVVLCYPVVILVIRFLSLLSVYRISASFYPLLLDYSRNTGDPLLTISSQYPSISAKPIKYRFFTLVPYSLIWPPCWAMCLVIVLQELRNWYY